MVEYAHSDGNWASWGVAADRAPTLVTHRRREPVEVRRVARGAWNPSGQALGVGPFGAPVVLFDACDPMLALLVG